MPRSYLCNKEEMMSGLRKPKQGTAIILWDDGFDELMAVTAVVEFRYRGIRTRLVSLNSRPVSPGNFGLMLAPDVSLADVSTEGDILCVVLPYTKISQSMAPLLERTKDVVWYIHYNFDEKRESPRTWRKVPPTEEHWQEFFSDEAEELK